MDSKPSIRILGFLFDGLQATSQSAVLVYEDDQIYFETAFIHDKVFAIKDLQFHPELIGVPRVIESANGLRFETQDCEAVRRLETTLHKTSWIHLIESSWTLSLTGAAMVVGLLAFIYFDLIPRYSSKLARKVPASVSSMMSRSAEKFLLYKPMKKDILSTEEWQRANTAIEDFEKHFHAKDIQIDIIESDKNDPNAFVIPNGHIFLNSALIQTADNSDQILAILLHEIGHYHHFHVMQSVLEHSAISTLIIFITGGTDWTNVPILILNNSYSRDNETQADDFSIQTMKEMNRDPSALADLFQKMADLVKNESELPKFLSTHPGFKERIQYIRRQSTSR